MELIKKIKKVFVKNKPILVFDKEKKEWVLDYTLHTHLNKNGKKI